MGSEMLGTGRKRGVFLFFVIIHILNSQADIYFPFSDLPTKVYGLEPLVTLGLLSMFLVHSMLCFCAHLLVKKILLLSLHNLGI